MPLRNATVQAPHSPGARLTATLNPYVNIQANSLIASFFISTVGLSFFIYGKKQRRVPQLVSGLAMMVFPYFVTNVPAMLVIGAALTVFALFASKLGL
ncbi:MAG: hypothetical protein Q8Q09_07070 [Deltaproteobacteria bacterium]|nr:hypothetical protein [Deltaproteobacteria bacterium]